MPKCALLYFLVLTSVGFSKAQTSEVMSGKVINYNTRLSLANATINVYRGKSVIQTIKTDSLGVFSLSLESYNKWTSIQISHLNYHNLTVYIEKKLNIKEGQTQTTPHIFELSPKTIELKEVVIRRNKRYRDTTIIDLNKQSFERSVMISDILKGNNGFYIDGANQLFYKGKKVTDITVDGGTFFGKNNLNVYENLPALVLKNIQIIETDIDSLTNITMIRPSVKINMSLKEEHKKGKFGSANLGIGTQTRYLTSTDLYKYNKDEQVSFAINSNNININTSQPSEPTIMFSANGNNIIKTMPKIEYRNVFLKKIEVMASINAGTENKTLISESERKEEILNQQTKVYNSSKVKSRIIDPSFANLIYRIDAQNTIKANFNVEHSKVIQYDSLDYNIIFDTLQTLSSLNKERTNTKKATSYEALYSKLFSSKKGRSLSIGIKTQKRIFQTTENNNVYALERQNPIRFYLNGTNDVKENEASLKINFINPVNDSSILFFGLNYKKVSIDYNETLKSDTLKNNESIPAKIINQYLNPSFKAQKNYDNIAVSAELGGIINFREISSTNSVFFNPDIDLNSDFRFNAKTNINIKYTVKPNWPTIDQLTNINNSFNLISQNSGNLNLKPELKQRLGFVYEFKRSDSLTVSFITGADVTSSKFGVNIISNPKSPQQTQIANVGTALALDASISISFLAKKGTSINFRSGLTYQQMPSVVNNQRISNDGVAFNHVLSSQKELIKGLLIISPTLAISNSIYYYGTSKSNLTSLTYSDKVALLVQKFQINLFPFINYSKGVGKNSSWAMNGEIKKTIFKNRGALWVKSYDIFNSFRYANNIVGPTYVETLKYSNLQRYTLLGISLKFNNIK